LKEMSITHIVDSIIKPELENVFGPALTARIIMSSRARSNAPIVNMHKEEFERLIDAICEDERVSGMWGASGIRERKEKWKQALKKVDGSGAG
jgi:hypothetical protein